MSNELEDATESLTINLADAWVKCSSYPVVMYKNFTRDVQPQKIACEMQCVSKLHAT